MSSEQPADPTDCKVGRVIDAYGLDGLGDELERRWLDDDGQSLRELAELVNKQLVEAALEDAAVRDTFEVESIHSRLRDDDVPAGRRQEVKRRLERRGVDVDGLLGSFVSHQAIHTYLTEFRDVTYPDREPDDRRRVAERSVKRLQSRLAAVTKSNIENLVNAEELSTGSIEVFVSVEVFCEDCGTSRPFNEFITANGCECSEQRHSITPLDL